MSCSSFSTILLTRTGCAGCRKKPFSIPAYGDILLNAALLCEPAEDAFACLKKMAGDPNCCRILISRTIMLVEQLLLRGQLETCEQHLASPAKSHGAFHAPFQGLAGFSQRRATKKLCDTSRKDWPSTGNKPKNARHLFQRHSGDLFYSRSSENERICQP